MVNRIDLHSPMRAEFNLRKAFVIDTSIQVLPTWFEGYQVGEGAFRLEHREIAFPGLEIAYFFTENTFADRYTIPTGETHFAFPLSPHRPTLSWAGHVNPSIHAIAVHCSNVEYISVQPPGWSGIYICMNDELVAALNLLPETFWEDSRDPERALLPVDPGRFSQFREFVRSWFLGVQKLADRGPISPQVAATLREQFLHPFRELLDRTFINRGDRSLFKPSRRSWIVESVCALVEADLASTPTTEELCQQLGVSPRAMQYAFKELMGVGVAQYIRARKLNAVREELIRRRGENVTVWAIAASYGFGHASRFAEQFRRQFGQYPSAVLRSGGDRH